MAVRRSRHQDHVRPSSTTRSACRARRRSHPPASADLTQTDDDLTWTTGTVDFAYDYDNPTVVRGTINFFDNSGNRFDLQPASWANVVSLSGTPPTLDALARIHAGLWAQTSFDTAGTAAGACAVTLITGPRIGSTRRGATHRLCDQVLSHALNGNLAELRTVHRLTPAVWAV